MSRYTGAKLRITRRLGDLPGLTNKKSKSRKRPGQHGLTKKEITKKLSSYAIRLEEKQKLRYNYGISEKQLINYIRKAKKIKGATGNIFLQLLEMRLDNVIFRLGMAPTIASARQIVGHKHITVNDLCVSIPRDIPMLRNVIAKIKLTAKYEISVSITLYSCQNATDRWSWVWKRR